MKFLIVFATTTLLALTGYSETQPASTNKSETVMVTYHVKAGKEDEFQKLLAHAWETYRYEYMTYPQPHTLVRQAENGGKTTTFVEIFTWVKPPENSPESVRSIWAQEQSLCEKRNGKDGIEFSEVHLVETK